MLNSKDTVSAPAAPTEQLLPFEKSLWDDGRERALASGATEFRDDEIGPLESHAEAMARRLDRERFDPETHPNDALRAEQHEKVLAQRAELEKKRPYGELVDGSATSRLLSGGTCYSLRQ